MKKSADRASTTPSGTVSVARALSKLGACSRAEGERLVESGRVHVNGVRVRSIGTRVQPETDLIEIDGKAVLKREPLYVALNKPRGLVTTRRDPQGRPTIYSCLTDPAVASLGAVGRLDKASEGLLLLTNDTPWAARLLDPASHVMKTYHVQVKGTGLDAVIDRVGSGIVEASTGETLAVRKISLLRSGSRNTAWFEILLDEGKNRHLRRIFAELDLEVPRLIRVSIGSVKLGELAKGEWRYLRPSEVASLASAAIAGRAAAPKTATRPSAR